MDYSGILNRAWEVTWKYKILWLFGLFAGSSVGGSSSAQNMPKSDVSVGQTSLRVEEAYRYIHQYGDLIIIGVCVGMVIGLLFYLLTILARVGLIHLVNEAEQGHEVRAADGWRAGRRKLWRVFGIEFLAGLPVMLPALAITAVFWSATNSFLALIQNESTWQAVAMGVGRAVGVGGFALLASSFVLILVLSLMIAVVEALAIRHAVIEDTGAVDSIKLGWKDLWSGRGAFPMFLIQAGIGIGIAIVASILGALFLGLVGLVMILGSAVYGAFYQAVWTIFFRRMTGMESQGAVAPVPVAPPLASDV
jgi:hypothetical protein